MAHGEARRGSEGEIGEWSGYPVPFTLPRNTDRLLWTCFIQHYYHY